MSLALLAGGKGLSPPCTCPFPLAGSGTCLPMKRNVKQQRKKLILTSEEGTQIYPHGPISPSSWIHYWPKNANGEPCLDWVGSWNSMLCTPVLKSVVVFLTNHL